MQLTRALGRLLLGLTMSSSSGFATLLFANPAEGRTQASARATTPSADQPQPKWFPRIACSSLSRDADPFAYEHSIDSNVEKGVGNVGYSTYRARVAKQTGGIFRQDCFKEWTVLVYMAADNDLNPYALWDLYEIEGSFASGKFAGSTARSDLLVEADLAGASGIRRYHMFQRPGRSYTPATQKEQFEKFRLEQIQSPIAELLPEPRLAPSQDHKRRFADFLRWGMRQYPARHYFVIVWGHGQGWAPNTQHAKRVRGRTLTPADLPFDLSTERTVSLGGRGAKPVPWRGRFGGLAFEELGGDYLGIPSLGEILRRVTRDTLENKRKIDVYASDACLMQMTEVAYELSDSTRFIAGSPQMTTLLGLPYRRLMYEINTARFLGVPAKIRNKDEAYYLAKMLPDLAARSLDPQRGSQGRVDKAAIETFTMSSLNSEELRHRLMPALETLSERLLQYIQEDEMRTMDLQFIMESTPSFMGGSRELGSFLGLVELQLKKEAEDNEGRTTPAARALFNAVRKTQDALRMTVVEYGYGPGYRKEAQPLHILGFRALAIWLPQSPEEYLERSADFTQSRFYRVFPSEKGVSRWQAWLKAVYDPFTSPM